MSDARDRMRGDGQPQFLWIGFDELREILGRDFSKASKSKKGSDPVKFPGMNEFVAAAKKGSGRSSGYAYNILKGDFTDLVSNACDIDEIYPVTCAVFHFNWHERNSRRDPDNITCGVKPILDGLVQAGILPNDNWKHVKGINHKWSVDKEHPGVMVVITEVAQDCEF